MPADAAPAQPVVTKPAPETARPYRPVGAALDLMYCKDPEVVLSGPAGTGKTRACLEKMFACAEKYPGMRGLVIRRTRESLTEAALVTWEQKVVPKGHACLTEMQRNQRQTYRFPNGSEIVVGGLDKPGKVMSTEYDLIYVQEAIELTEDRWENLTTRLRNGKMPYQQIIADTNPDKPKHWLKVRSGTDKYGNPAKLTMLESRHEDNPVLWDAQGNGWTKAGDDYISRLNGLTGPRKARLGRGQWVQAEGVVYEGFDANVHVIDRFHVPPAWARYLVVDFGFTNPFVAQWYAMDPDARLYMYREIYHTKRLVEDLAREAIAPTFKTEPRPRAVICDHDAEDRATLERHLGLKTVAAVKDVSPGIQEVEARLRKAADGKPRLSFMRDSLLGMDPDLRDRAKPTCTVDEFDGYVWDPAGNPAKKGEAPHKPQDDHGMDCVRYLCQWLAGKPKHGAAQISFPKDGGTVLDRELPPDIFHMV